MGRVARDAASARPCALREPKSALQALMFAHFHAAAAAAAGVAASPSNAAALLQATWHVGGAHAVAGAVIGVGPLPPRERAGRRARCRWRWRSSSQGENKVQVVPIGRGS